MPLHKDLTGTDLHPPGAHKTQHENGGSDEMSVAGLSGTLADPQPTTIAQITDATAAGKALLDDADAAAQRTTLGLGTMATAATSDYAALAGATFTGDVNVPDEAYDATNWNGSTEVPTKNAVRDKLEALSLGGGGAMTLITETVVGVGGAANVDFTSISSSYRDLRVVVRGRGDKAATHAEVRLRVNNDSGANYDYENVQGNTSSAGAGQSLGDTSHRMGWVTAASATSGIASACEITIYDYAGTTFQKQMMGPSGLKQGTSSGNLFVNLGACWWRSTSAINQVTVFPDSGNFIQGTVVSLYGIL